MWKRLLAAALASLALTTALGAFRWIPVLRAVTAHPKPVVDTDFLTLPEILFMMTRRTWSSWHFKGHIWVWPEYGAFVGWTVLALFVVGLIAVGMRLTGRWPQTSTPQVPRRELVGLLLGLVFFFLLTEGRASRLHPWPLLQELPIYKSIHLPSRWRVLLLFYLALLAGMGLDALSALIARLARRLGSIKLRETLPKALPAILAAVAIVDLYAVNFVIVNRWVGPPIGTRAPEAHHYLVQGRNYLDDFANYPAENVGTDRCYDPVPWKVSPHLRLGRVPQATVDAGTVLDWGRTSTTMWADVRLTAPATATFNQNMAPGWKSDQGTVVADRGLLALRIPGPFEGRVTVRFRPPDLPYSIALSAIGALACILIGRGTFRRRTRSP